VCQDDNHIILYYSVIFLLVRGTIPVNALDNIPLFFIIYNNFEKNSTTTRYSSIIIDCLLILITRIVIYILNFLKI